MNRLSLLVALSLFLSPPAFAAEAERLQLNDVLERVETTHPSLQAGQQAIEAARARVVTAGAPANPEAWLRFEQVPPTQWMAGTYEAGVTQPVALGDRLALARQVALAEVRVREAALQEQRWALRTRAKVAFARVLVAKEARVGAETRAQTAQRVLKAVEARWKAGEVPPYEVQRSRVDAARAQHATVEARAEEALAMSRLNLLLGRPARSLWVPVGPLMDPRPLPPLQRLRDTSETRRPELVRLEAQLAQAEAAEKVAVASRWTGFDWTAGGGMSNGQAVLSTEARVPFPLWYGREGEQAEARAEQAQYRAERQALVQQVHLEVEEAYRRWQEANHELELFRESLLPASEQLVKLAELRYKEGAGSGLELHEAHAARQETLASYWAIVLDQREAIADLERAAAVEE